MSDSTRQKNRTTRIGQLPTRAQRPYTAPNEALSVVLVGSPNVGKSVIFGNLTGTYVTVSNYPGTTVEVSRGRGRIGELDAEVVDTPGMYGLLPISEEERVARQMLLEGTPSVIVHVIDAQSAERMLPLTLQLLEIDAPLVLVLNMMDEAEHSGLVIDVEELSRRLGITVIPTVATTGQGMDELRDAIVEALGRSVAGRTALDYGVELEAAVDEVAQRLPEGLRSQARAVSLLLLQGDADLLREVREASPDAATAIEASALRLEIDAALDPDADTPETDTRSIDVAYLVASKRQARCRELLHGTFHLPRERRRAVAESISHLLIRPVTGIPVLLLVTYLGLYKFVGELGAGTAVDFLENDVFGAHVSPWFEKLLYGVLPGDGGWHYWARELFVGDSGILTLGVTYAVAIVLPVVCLFFIFFSVLEDSGYFPRLAMLVDRAFKGIGLNGRAVIPIVLGFACDTMATLVTRVQETKRERVITTLLLALAIPCSAQYGVITALLADQPGGVLGVSFAFLVWAGVILLVFMVAGRVASRTLQGAPASFYMELPPLRVPRIGNVVTKTMARMKWYLLEVLPIFVLASVLIWLGRITGLFELLIQAMHPLMWLLGLPNDAANVFLYGFFRRDFGAAGLYALAQSGALDTGQIVVACVTLTLFLPCIAQLLVMKKERGNHAALVIAALALATAFVVGAALNLIFAFTGVWS